MTEKVRIDWSLDQDEVIMAIEVRMDARWFIDQARRVYQALCPMRRRADRLIEVDPIDRDSDTRAPGLSQD